MFNWLNVPMAAGLLFLAVSLFLILRKPGENSPTTPMFLVGAALIALSDPSILNLKVGASGVEVTRKELADAKQDYAAQIAELAHQIAAQKIAISDHARALNNSVSMNTGSSGPLADAIAISPAHEPARSSDNLKAFAENSKTSVLVFYRAAQQTLATQLAAALVTAGYQSSATQTTLDEITPNLTTGTKANDIIIAAESPDQKNASGALLTDGVKSVIEKSFGATPSRKPTIKLDPGKQGWSFSRGDIQIYLF